MASDRNARLVAFQAQYGDRLESLTARLMGNAPDGNDLTQDVYAALLAPPSVVPDVDGFREALARRPLDQVARLSAVD